MKYADIVIPVPLTELLTYSIPVEIEQNVKIGMRVSVSLGSKKIYTGIVFNLHNNKPEDYSTKPLENLLDDFPILMPLHMDMWEWMAEYYCCSIGEIMRAALPSALKPESETYVISKTEYDESIRLSQIEQNIFQHILADKAISVKLLAKQIQSANILSVLNKLQEKGRIRFEKNVHDKYVPAFIEIVELVKKPEDYHQILDSLKRAPKQHILITYIVDSVVRDGAESSILLTDVLRKTGITRSILNSLVKKEYLSIKKQIVSRFEETDATSPLNTLNKIQTEAYNQIKDSFIEKSTVLLHGVTGSGKTEIYIHLIQQMLEDKKQVLYLLPEIALTTQIIRKLKRVFGSIVGVFHSKYSDAARAEVWSKLRKNEYKVILGVRSAVFLPFSNLGLVIVDEEHEISYKQFNPAPRYNARDTGIYMANKSNAKVLLGTATPSGESYYNAKIGKYALVELNTRFSGVKMPHIKIVDLSDAYKRRVMQEHFHPELVEAIKIALDNGEQVILFQNRRGFSPYVECRDCGWVPQCKQCNVNYTYHKFGNRLICHYCGANIKMPETCPKCGSNKISNRGFGTEMLEEEAGILFPDASIARMDMDTTTTRKKYEKIIGQFENGEIDILIGTQMVTKGLDFENVGVVGIMNADNLLNFPDFRAFERSYHLMAQVSGRSGRQQKRGNVLIQTRTPEHEIIKYVVENDYQAMFQSQMEERQLFRYPPYYRFIKIVIKHKDKNVLDSASRVLANNLQNKLQKRVSNTLDPIVGKIFNFYIKEILVRVEPKLSSSQVKSFILQHTKWLSKQSKYSGLVVQIDVDPL